MYSKSLVDFLNDNPEVTTVYFNEAKDKWQFVNRKPATSPSARYDKRPVVAYTEAVTSAEILADAAEHGVFDDTKKPGNAKKPGRPAK